MSNQEKARLFLTYQQAGDPRCEILIALLSMYTGSSVDECQRRIKELAK